jgi:hypothetical protein
MTPEQLKVLEGQIAKYRMSGISLDISTNKSLPELNGIDQANTNNSPLILNLQNLNNGDIVIGKSLLKYMIANTDDTTRVSLIGNSFNTLILGVNINAQSDDYLRNFIRHAQTVISYSKFPENLQINQIDDSLRIRSDKFDGSNISKTISFIEDFIDWNKVKREFLVYKISDKLYEAYGNDLSTSELLLDDMYVEMGRLRKTIKVSELSEQDSIMIRKKLVNIVKNYASLPYRNGTRFIDNNQQFSETNAEIFANTLHDVTKLNISISKQIK